MKKILLLILCIVLITVPLTSCNESGEAPAPSASIGIHGIDYNAAFASFPPETVMLVAGEYTITWAELYFNIRSVLNSLYSSYGEIPDLSEIMPDGTTYGDAVLNYAIDNALVYRAIELGAKTYGATLSDDDHMYLYDEYGSIAESYGGMDEFLEILWEEDGINSFDLFYYLYSIPYLAENTFTEQYGANGLLLPDEDVAENTVTGGYLMAKHILRLKSDDGDETPLRETEEILLLLEEYEGDDFDSYFDSLMYDHSEDAGGLSSFPNGYLFQYGDMVPEFYDACMALEIGQYSGVVETTYGYHIVYKMPLNYDEIPMYNYSQYDYRTLRGIIAQGLFNNSISDWVEHLSPVHTSEYDSMDIAEIFKKAG